MQTYTTKQAAKMLNLGYSTLAHILHAGHVPVHRGKGGKHYIITNETISALKVWLRENPNRGRRRKSPSVEARRKAVATRRRKNNGAYFPGKGKAKQADEKPAATQAKPNTMHEDGRLIEHHLGALRELIKRRLDGLANLETVVARIEEALR